MQSVPVYEIHWFFWSSIINSPLWFLCYSLNLFLHLLCEKPQQKLKISQYLKENPDLVPESRKTRIKTDENDIRRIFAFDLVSFSQMTPVLKSEIDFQCLYPA